MKAEQKQFNCPVEATLSLIGGKYKPLVLWHLKSQSLHYMELQRLIPKATPKMLSGQLHDLEDCGMINREANRKPLHFHDVSGRFSVYHIRKN